VKIVNSKGRPRNSKGRWKPDQDIREERMKMAAMLILGIAFAVMFL
jgi:hypothetical protein